MRPSQVVTTLEDLFSSKTGRLRRKGVELSARDNQTAQEVYQSWLLLLLDLDYLPREEFCREAGRFVSHFMKTDVLDTLNISAEIVQLVYRQIPGAIKGFKALCHNISPNLFNIIRDDVYATRGGDAIAAKRLIQFFAYPSRLSLLDLDLTEQCLSDYMETENAMQDCPRSTIVGSISKTIQKWFKGIDLEDLCFKHGNGSTAGGIRNIEDKYKSLASDSLTSYAFGDSFKPIIANEPAAFAPITCVLQRISQTIFVPKSYKTFRTISMEPATLMFLQQGIWNAIDQHVNTNRYLRDRIGFHDQNRNQVLAREGSLSRNFATIDLSAASDSVSWDLVKKVFRRTKLLRYLVATRSTKTLLPDGRLIDLKKFAPMGSALCFPIETIIFAAICEVVTREHGHFGKYSVFGDDIIVPSDCVDDLFYCLELLGFRPNKDKSFYDESVWFRESCGGEYIDGYDVTPMRISRQFTSEHTIEAAQGVIDMANTAFDRGFTFLRSFLMRKLNKIADTLQYVPYFSPTSLRGPSYSNFHTKRRWNSRLQRIECYVTLLKTAYADRNDDIAYYEYLRRNNDSRNARNDVPDWLLELQCIPKWDDEATVVQTGRPIVSSVRKWVEKPFEYDGDSNFSIHFSDLALQLAIEHRNVFSWT